MAKNSVKAQQLSTLNGAALGAAYQPVNVGGFTDPVFMLRIVNANSTAITVSYDGITDHDYVPVNGVLEVQAQTNAQPNAQIALFNALTTVYVKGTAGAGTIAVTGYYV